MVQHAIKLQEQAIRENRNHHIEQINATRLFATNIANLVNLLTQRFN